ncbi:HAD-IIB family hydrolase [Zhihengliuella salsuginis]|uniref:Haloacid dehalogenase n=1 Tax=Zhihengliuella salsuginis TaxID=578222 RepID=A0ABQ3GGY2_9MICC|nr:HAD family hydrolase [Zhihengliuella salsuginis]GHD05699.1 haloacid dehalogenase [Zhihengliuella salsuginis]
MHHKTTPERGSGDAVRAVFLDVDGTYAAYGVVPPGHVAAVRAARSAGHRVFLCTGRPLSMLDEHLLGAGFDGVVASAGAYAEVGSEVLLDRHFPADLAAATVAALDAHDAVYLLETQEALHTPPAAEQRLRAHVEAHFSRIPGQRDSGSSAILNALRPTVDRAAAAFAKVSVLESPVPMSELVAQIGEGVAVVENSIADEGRHAGELFQRGISKADGVAAVLAHLGIDREHSVAAGDGENDLEMIEFAGVGIVIEGASERLLALADLTAAPPRAEGLVAAFAELGLV